MSENNHFFIIAGERSGDIHGGMLMNSLKNLNSNIEFSGIGGTSMEDAGLESMFPINKMAIVGFVEVIKHLKFFKKVERTVLKTIQEKKPDRIILIDFPGFNLRIAKKIQDQFQIPITYYISPQLWAWKENRIEIIKKYIDQMLVILPFEKDWYAKRGVNVDWIGHPYLDHQNTNMNKDELKKHYGINDNLLLTLFPGSRQLEVDRHMPLFMKACKILMKNNPQLKIGIGLAPGVELNKKYNDIAIVETNNTHQLLAASDILFTASGTATLEASILGLPMGVVYKLNFITWILSKWFIKIKYIALPNIIFNKPIVPEFIQSNANPNAMVDYAQRLINDKAFRKSTSMELAKIKNILGKPGASDRAAQKILEN